MGTVGKVSGDILAGLVSNALERMMFVVVEPSDLTAGEMIACGVAHSSFDLHGTKNYVVTVSATDGFVQEVASGMMGCELDEIDVDDHASATVSELANVFGGELVMMMADDDVDLMIGLPCLVTDEEVGSWVDRATANGLVCILGTDHGALMVSFAAD